MSGPNYYTNNNTTAGPGAVQVTAATAASPYTITITVPDTNPVTYTIPGLNFTSGVVFPDWPRLVIDPWAPTVRAPDAALKARRLVERLLTVEQLRTWDTGSYVDIPSAKHPRRVYRLMPIEHNPDEPGIEVYEGGTLAAFVCLHVGHDLLRDDRLVAKVLLCRYAEEEIETVGNWSFKGGHRVDRRREPVDVAVAGLA